MSSVTVNLNELTSLAGLVVGDGKLGPALPHFSSSATGTRIPQAIPVHSIGYTHAESLSNQPFCLNVTCARAHRMTAGSNHLQIT